MPFSFASVRARTQDQRDILKWGALSLPTELPIVDSNKYRPFVSDFVDISEIYWIFTDISTIFPISTDILANAQNQGGKHTATARLPLQLLYVG